MATDRQIAANRQNALKSTGPTSVEGKMRSRTNALVHGMAGASGFVENGMSPGFASRRDEWAARYGLLDPSQEFTLDRLVAASVRIEQCENAIDSVMTSHMLRGKLAWDVDQKVLAAILASKLAKNPMLVRRQLDATRHGCELMLELWGYIGKVQVEWTDALMSQALDLLGIPIEARDGLTPLDPPQGIDRATHLAAMIQGETKRLHAIMEGLTTIDALERSHAEEGSVALLSKNAQLLMRYEREAWRRFYQCSKELRAADVIEQPAPITATPPPKPAPLPPNLTPPRTTPRPDPLINDHRYSYVDISASPPLSSVRANRTD